MNKAFCPDGNSTLDEQSIAGPPSFKRNENQANKGNSGTQYRVWGIILGVISIAYLAAELAFNSLVIDTVAGMPTIADTERLELLGRSISGFGFTLIVWGMLKKLRIRNTRKFVSMVLALIICFPLMFFGQKALIDYVVDRSSGEQRLLSRYMSLLKAGLANGLISIQGLPIDTTETQSAGDKTFLSLVGGLIYFNPTFLQTVENNQAAIVDQVIRRMSSDKVDARYDNYLNIRKDVGQYWGDYKTGTKAYYSAIDGSSANAQEAWVDMNTQLHSYWNDFAKGRDDWTQRWGTEADNYFPQAKKMFLKWSRCRTSKVCNKRAGKRYRKEMERVFGRTDIAFTHWCVNPYVALLFFPDDSYRVQGRQCPVKQSLFKEKFIEASELKFRNQAGLKFETTEIAFLSSDYVREKMIKNLKEMDIDLPDGWTISNKADFVRGVNNKIKKEAGIKFRKSLPGLSSKTLSPGLSYDEFIQSDTLQSEVKNRMGVAYTPNMRFNWQKDAFFKKVMEPAIISQVKTEVDNLKRGATHFENGKELEGIGKQSMRSILVPPIAIAFSLFFGIWNFMNIVAGSLLSLSGRWISRTLKRFILGGLATAVLITPFFLPSYFAENKVVGYFVSESKTTSPLLGNAFDWVIRLQPLVYPVGLHIREQINIGHRTLQI